MDEQQLLERYAEDQSPEAFAELVRRNVDLVYAGATRQLRDPHLAEDVTQAVFMLLAKKTGRVRGALAGWLVKATWFTCRDAKRIRDRRAYHERRAMEMRSEVKATGNAGDEPAWETYAPLLDEALLTLRTRDREALTFRYLKGLSLREVGAAQGISEEAARKRVDRATARLREAMATKTEMPGTASLAATLGSHALHAAPTGLGQTIAATTDGIAKGSLAHAIAHGGAKCMAWAQAKVIAAAVIGTSVVVLATGTYIAIASHHGPVAPAPMVAAAAPAVRPTFVAVNPDADESNAPGLVQLARWDVILTQAGADAVGKVLRGEASKSVGYAAFTANSVALRRAVRQALADDEVPGTSTQMQIADEWNDHKSLLLPIELWFHYPNDKSSQYVSMNGGSSQNNDTLDRTDATHLHLKLSHTDIQADINENGTRFVQTGPRAIVYDGTLAAGDAIAFLGKSVASSGTPYYHLVVWETFKAQPEQMTTIYERDAAWWCENGPARLRAWADAARLWTTEAPAQTAVAPAFEKKLSDGKILRLEALCRPSQWPGCWWDAEGNPTRERFMVTFQGDPPEGLWALVAARGNDEKEGTLVNPTRPGGQGPDTIACQTIDESAGAIELGVAVGEWKQLATLEMNKPQTVDGVEYRISRARPIDNDDFLVHFLRVGVLDNDDMLVAIAADGRKAYTQEERTVIFGHEAEPTRKEDQPNYYHMSLSDVKTWRVMQRKRQWVTFTGFAAAPKTIPPASVTNEAANSAERVEDERKRRAASDALGAQRKIWAAIPPDRTTVQGALRAMIDAARAGDEAALRKMFIATKPAAQACLDLVPRYAIAREQTAEALTIAVGLNIPNDELYTLSSAHGYLAVDMEDDLFAGQWKATAPNRRQMEHYWLDKCPDGIYRLNLDSMDPNSVTPEALAAMTIEQERLRDILRTKHHLTIPELKAILDPPPSTATTQK